MTTQIDTFTQNALACGRSALRNYGPEAAVAAMKPWADCLERAERKQSARTERNTMRKSRLTAAEEGERLLTPGDVATLLGVDPKTVRRWSVEGKLPSGTTPGGHRRYRYADILPFMAMAPAATKPEPQA